MTAYYNEIDPYAAEWLRNLIRAGHIADGVVDTRSIEDVRPADLTEFTQCHFFAGIGGWSLALRMAGWDDTRPVWTGSCPCQPFSQAGKGSGMDDDRHLWPAWFHLIGQCRPATIFGEQVEAAIAHGWLDLVQDDLEGIGYAFAPVGLPAASVGAPHIRHRLWWVANANQGERGRLAIGEGRRSNGEASGRIKGNGITEYGGASGELAHAAIPRPLPGALGRVRGGEEGTGSRDAEPERLMPVGPLADGDGDGDGRPALPEREQSTNQRDTQPCGSMGNPNTPGLPLRQSPELQGTRGGHEGRAIEQPSGSPLAGFWADADWLACRDGKARPIEPGAFPLAPRLPNHVGRLRAYGNAIVPEVGAEVIKAVMECAP